MSSIDTQKHFFNSVTSVFNTWKTHKFVSQRDFLKILLNLQMEYP